MSADPARRPDRSADDDGQTAELAEAEQAASGDTPEAVSDASLPAPPSGLSERDRQILDLESRTFRYVGSKERAIREEIGISKVAYYVRLNSLLDDPAALRAAPSVVNRLRGQRVSEDGPGAAHGIHRVA